MSQEGPGLRVGRYLVGGRIGVGGMGEVRVALQAGLGRYEKPVALKLLLPHLSESSRAVEMFLDEARLASLMSHPNVVQVFDVGCQDGRYFLAMELVRGVSLSELVRAMASAGEPPLTEGMLRRIGRGLCDALHHAHQLRDRHGRPLALIHRDVTPHNVLLSERGEVKLTDFGVARALDREGLTAPGALKGKLPYVAPEQALNLPLDARVDVYGAALTLYWAASGHSPYTRSSDAATLHAVLNEPLADLATLRPDLGPELCRAIHLGAERDAARRLPTALALREALGPEPAEEVAEALGALVRRRCVDHLQLVQREQTRILTLDVGSPPTRAGRASSIPAVATRQVALAAGALGLLLCAGLLAWAVRPGGRAAPAPQSTAPEQGAVSSPERAPAGPPPPREGEAAAPAAAPPAQSAELTPKRRAAPPKKAPARFGSLSVEAVPWAYVKIDGRPAGETPLASYPVPVGRVVVELTAPDRTRTHRQVVRVAEGKDHVVKVSFE